MLTAQSRSPLTWRPRRRLEESDDVSGAMSTQWEAPGMRRADSEDSEGPEAAVTLSACQGSMSPRKEGGMACRAGVRCPPRGQGSEGRSPLTKRTRVAPGVWPP